MTTFEDWTWRGTCVHVVDGDTLDVIVTLRDETRVLCTIDPDPDDHPLTTLLDVTDDLGFRITEQRIITSDGSQIVERRIVRFEDRIRLYGVNTPERGEPGNVAATAGLWDLVFDPSAAAGVARPLICRTIKPREKYGRWLATVEVVGGVRNVSTELVRLGLGVAYYGGTR